MLIGDPVDEIKVSIYCNDIGNSGKKNFVLNSKSMT